MSELSEVFQNKFGKDGYILEERVNLIIAEHTGNLISAIKEIFESLEESLVYHSKIRDELFSKLSKTSEFVKAMLNAPTRKIANAIIKTRDFLKIPFKFKPYGAQKFAKFLKAMPIVMEVLQLGVNVVLKIRTDKKRSAAKNEIENAFQGLIQDFTLDSYTAIYFPFVAETLKVLSDLEESEKEIRVTILKIDKISNEIKGEIKGLG